MSTEPVARRSPSAPRRDARAAASMMVDLVCDSRTRETAVNQATHWCRRRPIPVRAVQQVTTLLDEAVVYGLRFGPRSLRMRMAWVSHGRILIGLTWHGCAEGAVCSSGELERTAETFELLADAWGFEPHRAGPTHWFVVDASR